MLRPFLLIAVGFLLTLALAACGGGGPSNDDDDLDLDIDFSVEGGVLSVDEMQVLAQSRLARVDFLVGWLTLAESFQEKSRGLRQLAELERTGLDVRWVRQVHDLSRKNDLIYAEAQRLAPPQEAGQAYAQLLADFTAGVDSFHLSSGRLLDAAIIFGPASRAYDDLNALDQTAFDSARRQARFYEMDAALLLQRTVAGLEDAIDALQVGDGE